MERPATSLGVVHGAHAAGAVGALLMLLVSAAAQAQAPSRPQAQLPEGAVVQAVALALVTARAAAPPEARVVAEAGAIDARLQLAPCDRAEAFASAGQPAWGRTLVGLRCAGGPGRWRVFIPVTVQVHAPAVVATTALPAGTTVQAAQLALAEVDWAESRGAVQAEIPAVAGRTLSRAVVAGQALRSTDLLPRQWFGAGDTVRIEAAGSGFTAQAEGQALGPGLDGQPARVRTETGRVLTGRPVGTNRIEVQL